MNAFAGFWVDGAVRKPEQRHRDRNNWIVANWKDTGNDFDICQPNFDDWDKVYWLDTTPRESLTPPPMASILLSALFQSAGTLHVVPLVMMYCVTASPWAGPPPIIPPAASYRPPVSPPQAQWRVALTRPRFARQSEV